MEEHDLKYDENTRNLHYIQAGPAASKELIVFMHGWPGIAKTWYNQFKEFASQGYLVVAPDMPGWGKSSIRKEYSDYAQERMVTAMLALLRHLDYSQAIWIGHDWGCATLWSLARRHPEVCKAVCGITIPYATMELGVEEMIRFVNRELYPEKEYPYGQWSYQVYYELEFEKVTAWYEQDIRGFLKSMFVKSNPADLGQRAPTSTTVRDGGRAGGAEKPLAADQTPDSAAIMRKDVFDELVSSLEKNSFWSANALYMNHSRNKAFNTANQSYDKRLQMPVLFIEAKYDNICDTATSDFAKRQSELCDDLTYVSVESGHFVAVEKPEEVNKAISDWLIAKDLTV